MKVKEIYEFMDRFAPFAWAEEFDNCGLIIGDMEAEITKIGLALDITNPILDQAVEQGIDLIITHHPVIFHPLKRIYAHTPAYRLVQHGISHIAAHTNLDKAEGGVNTVLADYYGLKEVTSPSNLKDLGRIGVLETPITASEYACQIKTALGSSSLRYYDSGRPVQKVAYISGGGGGQFAEALACGIDTFVTGDLKHDQYIEAQNQGFNLIEANHFDSENKVLGPLAVKLREICPQELPILMLSTENPVHSA